MCIAPPTRACNGPRAAWTRPRVRSRETRSRMPVRCPRPSAVYKFVCPSVDGRRHGLVASQNSFAVEVGFAPRHVPGVVAMPVELQDQEWGAGSLAREVLDIAIRP